MRVDDICISEHITRLILLAGVRLEHATISDRVLGRIDNLYMSITDITVHLLEISLPTMSRPLTLTLSGVTVELMQRTLPQVCSSCSFALCAYIKWHLSEQFKFCSTPSQMLWQLWSKQCPIRSTQQSCLLWKSCCGVTPQKGQGKECKVCVRLHA